LKAISYGDYLRRIVFFGLKFQILSGPNPLAVAYVKNIASITNRKFHFYGVADRVIFEVFISAVD
jgi:hypothetical protein